MQECVVETDRNVNNIISAPLGSVEKFSCDFLGIGCANQAASVCDGVQGKKEKDYVVFICVVVRGVCGADFHIGKSGY